MMTMVQELLRLGAIRRIGPPCPWELTSRIRPYLRLVVSNEGREGGRTMVNLDNRRATFVSGQSRVVWVPPLQRVFAV